MLRYRGRIVSKFINSDSDGPKKDRQSTIGGLLRLFQNGGIIIGPACSLILLETNISPVTVIFRINVFRVDIISVFSLLFLASCLNTDIFSK